MVWRSTLALLLLAAQFVAFGSVALANEPDPERAKALYVEAKRLHEEGRVRESMSKLQEAYEAYPSEAILVSIVNRHLDLGEVEEASELLAHVQADRGKIKRQVARLRRQIDKALALPVTVMLTADAEGAMVAVDGGEPVALPARLDLPRGRHRFAFSADGRSDVEIVEMLKGSLEIPISAKLSVPTGSWRVTMEPQIPLKDVRLTLNGEAVRMGRSELEKHISDPRAVLPGEYTLVCLRGFEARAEDVVFHVEHGETAALTCTFPKETSLDISVWAWVTGGAAVAAIIAGSGVLGNYYAELPALQDQYVNDPNYAGRYEIVSSKPAVGWTLIGVGSALGVASGLFFAKVFE